MTTVRHRAAVGACATRAAYISKALPPANVESVRAGRMPRWSVARVAANRPVPAVAGRSTSDRASPASAGTRVTP